MSIRVIRGFLQCTLVCGIFLVVSTVSAQVEGRVFHVYHHGDFSLDSGQSEDVIYFDKRNRYFLCTVNRMIPDGSPYNASVLRSDEYDVFQDTIVLSTPLLQHETVSGLELKDFVFMSDEKPDYLQPKFVIEHPDSLDSIIFLHLSSDKMIEVGDEYLKFVKKAVKEFLSN